MFSFQKYPTTFDEFQSLRLSGAYDPERGGKRMRLPVPETWETQVALRGNRAEVWQDLLDHRKLPYMAMLRNLRNLIKSGVSARHHDTVVKKLQDEGAVMHSKQFPFRFFAAYDVLDTLEREHADYTSWCNNSTMDANPQAPAPACRRGAAPAEKAKAVKAPKDCPYDAELLRRYKAALDAAVKVATRLNVAPIRGKTLLCLDMASGTSASSAAVTGLGSRVANVAEQAALLALMFKHACEYSKLLVYGARFSDCVYDSLDSLLSDDSILANVRALCEFAALPPSGGSGSGNGPMRPAHPSWRHALRALCADRGQHRELTFDNIVILSARSGQSSNDSDGQLLRSFLRQYRAERNSRLLFVNVSLSAASSSSAQCQLDTSSSRELTHPDDVRITGFSDSILRFVAERATAHAQLVHIDHIDSAYKLAASATQLKQQQQRQVSVNKDRDVAVPRMSSSPWRTVKVFISSTFTDMHGERDMLTRLVFPMLRAKLAARLRLHIYEIDMRWGIVDTGDSLDSLHACLRQVLECDYFVAVLGERYGHTLATYTYTYTNTSKQQMDARLAWLETYPSGASVTELEIECALRSRDQQRMFFYMRDSSVLKRVPSGPARAQFTSHHSEQDTLRLARLKQRIRELPALELYDGYPADWLGFDSASSSTQAPPRPLLTNLEQFAHRVFDNLYSAMSKHYAAAEQAQSGADDDELVQWNSTNGAYVAACAAEFTEHVGGSGTRAKLVASVAAAATTTTTTRVLLVSGAPSGGSGKTTLLAHLAMSANSANAFAHFVGAFEHSDRLELMLKRLCRHVVAQLSAASAPNIEELARDVASAEGVAELKRALTKLIVALNAQMRDDSPHNPDIFTIFVDDADRVVAGSSAKCEPVSSWLPAPAVLVALTHVRFVLTLASNNNNNVNNNSSNKSSAASDTFLSLRGMNLKL